MRTKRKFPIVEAGGVTLVPLEEYVRWLRKNGEAGRLSEKVWFFCKRLHETVPSLRGRCLKKPKPALCSGCNYNQIGESRRD